MERVPLGPSVGEGLILKNKPAVNGKMEDGWMDGWVDGWVDGWINGMDE